MGSALGDVQRRADTGPLGLVTKLGIPRRISVNDLDQQKRRLPNPKAMMGERMRRVRCAVHGHGLLALPLGGLGLGQHTPDLALAPLAMTLDLALLLAKTSPNPDLKGHFAN